MREHSVTNSLLVGEAFAHSIIHAETKRKYDPVKRREYYLKTRELKGRRKGRSKRGDDIMRTDADRHARTPSRVWDNGRNRKQVDVMRTDNDREGRNKVDPKVALKVKQLKNVTEEYKKVSAQVDKLIEEGNLLKDIKDVALDGGKKGKAFDKLLKRKYELLGRVEDYTWELKRLDRYNSLDLGDMGI